jgi:hypothetical protein
VERAAFAPPPARRFPRHVAPQPRLWWLPQTLLDLRAEPRSYAEPLTQRVFVIHGESAIKPTAMPAQKAEVALQNFGCRLNCGLAACGGSGRRLLLAEGFPLIMILNDKLTHCKIPVTA